MLQPLTFLFWLGMGATRLENSESTPINFSDAVITNLEHYRAWQLNHKDKPFPSVSSYPNEEALIVNVKKAIATGTEKTGKAPRVLVIGALGRCGSGAVDLCLKAGVPTENVLKWDMAETGNDHNLD